MNTLEKLIFPTSTMLTISPELLVMLAMVLMIVIAFFAYRFNYRTQMRVSLYIDTETEVFNKTGIIKYLKNNNKKFKNPCMITAYIENLNFLYDSASNPDKASVMIEIADTFLYGMTKHETMARTNFDRFVMVFDGKSKEEMKELVASFEERLSKLHFEEIGGYNFFVKYGLYEDADISDPDKAVDRALAVIPYSDVMEKNIYYYGHTVEQALSMMDELELQKYDALEQHQFVPFIQPKVDFITGKVVGGEILVRWVDSNGNVVHPAKDFIPFFESNGFIRQIDLEMFEQACILTQNYQARGYGHIMLSVNISKVNFESASFIETLDQIRSKYNVRANQIELEITETTAMAQSPYFINCIMKLKNSGYKLALNDFGKEYTSLGSLSNNPFDTIKMDVVLFENSLRTDKEKIITKNILSMLDKLNCNIVCEGINNKDTLDILAKMNRRLIVQGYAISMPLSAPQFESFIPQVMHFDYPDIIDVEEVSENNTKLIGQKVGNEELDLLKQQMEEMRNLIIGSRNQEANTVDPKYEQLQAELEAMKKAQADAQLLAQQKAFEEQQKAMFEAQQKALETLTSARVEVKEPQETEEMAKLRKQLEELKEKQAQELEEIKRKREEEEKDRKHQMEIDSLRQQLESLRRNPYDDQARYRSSEFDYLRNQIESLRNTQYYNGQYDSRFGRSEIDDLRYQIEQLRRQTSEKDAEYQHTREMDQLRNELKELRNTRQQVVKQADDDELSRLRKEIEALKAKPKEEPQVEEVDEEDDEEANALGTDFLRLLDEIQELDSNEPAEMNAKDLQTVNLSLDALPTDEITDDDDDSDEKLTTTATTSLSKADVEGMVNSLMAKYDKQWLVQARSELTPEQYQRLIDAINYYAGQQKLNFSQKMKRCSEEQKTLYNIVKNEIMKYDNVTSKVSRSCDKFFVKKKCICKVNVSKKSIKVMLALDPDAYPKNQYPHKDLSNVKAHAKTPFYFTVRSKLSVKRVQALIFDLMEENGCPLKADYKPLNYAYMFRFYKKNNERK